MDESLYVESTARSARDRSDQSYRFVDVLRAARRRQTAQPPPAVRVTLSEKARQYAAQHGDAGAAPEKTKPRERSAAYGKQSRRGARNGQAPASSVPEDGEEDND